jgi:hypothetical protein
VAAEAFDRHTRLTSLQLTSKDAEQSGHGPGLSLAWNRQGKPLAGVDTPLANLWLTLLQGVGIETDSFGDATGTRGDLTA